MRERSTGTFTANYVLVIVVEALVITTLWLLGRYFG
jgi:hypothetical protein